jgi:hypothetical protein
MDSPRNHLPLPTTLVTLTRLKTHAIADHKTKRRNPTIRQPDPSGELCRQSAIGRHVRRDCSTPFDDTDELSGDDEGGSVAK